MLKNGWVRSNLHLPEKMKIVIIQLIKNLLKLFNKILIILILKNIFIISVIYNNKHASSLGDWGLVYCGLAGQQFHFLQSV